MKEIKEFIQELCDCAKPSANGSVVTLEDATRIVASAFAAGMNFQDHEIKRKHKFRHFEKEGIHKVADFKFIPNPANGGDDDYIIADMVFKEYTYGESGEEPFCDAMLAYKKRWNNTIDLSCEDFFKMKQLVQRGTKLQAVKHVKESTRCGLKEAKDFVDTYCDYVLND